MNTTIISMAGVAVVTAVGEKVSAAFGKQELAQMISIAGLSLLGIAALKLVKDLLGTCTNLF